MTFSGRCGGAEVIAVHSESVQPVDRPHKRFRFRGRICVFEISGTFTNVREHVFLSFRKDSARRSGEKDTRDIGK